MPELNSRTAAHDTSSARSASEWLIRRGPNEPDDRISALPDTPPRRDLNSGSLVQPATDSGSAQQLEAHRHKVELHPPGAEVLEIVNAALYLCFWLLVTGKPGTGKCALAHAMTYELGLGRMLRWPVVSRTVLRDGLYHYDAIARLQHVQIAAPQGAGPATAASSATHPTPGSVEGIGNYIRLGPLGTALLPSNTPRVLLIDELDKNDIDLPNDLLNVLEEDEFAIPEPGGIPDRKSQAEVLTGDRAKVTVVEGQVPLLGSIPYHLSHEREEGAHPVQQGGQRPGDEVLLAARGRS